MRFLADESCDFDAVRALRSDGHDVRAIGEFQNRSLDPEVMELALSEDRVLLTEDKDFGWLAFVAQSVSPGVILIRFPSSARKTLANAVRRLVREHGSKLYSSFVVLQPGSARVGPRPLPGTSSE